MPRSKVNVVQVCQQCADELGMVLVDVEFVKDPIGKILRIYVDCPGMDLNHCERYHKRVIPLLEDVDFDYLEVSSPGLDRPLKKPADYKRNERNTIEVKLYQPVDGQKEFQGVLSRFDEEGFTITSAAGVESTFAYKAAAMVRPVLDFDFEELGESEQ